MLSWFQLTGFLFLNHFSVIYCSRVLALALSHCPSRVVDSRRSLPVAEDGGHAGLSPPEGGAQPGAQKSGKPGSARVCVNAHVPQSRR